MILRTVHNRENPYFQLDRTAVNDERLSYKAIGIHTYLMSKPDGWEANESDITARHTDGRSAIRSGIQELIEHGYMVRVQIRKDKKVVSWRLDTYETPILNPHFKPGQPAKVVTIDLDTQDLECENLNVGSSNNVHLESEKLQVEKLDVENRTHSNYIYTVTNELKRVTEVERQPVQVYAPPSADEYLSGLPDPRKRNGKVSGAAENTMQAKLLGVSAEQFRLVVDSLLDGFGKKPLADAGDERTLNHAQLVALTVMGISEKFRTPEGIADIFASWRENDYRGDTVPTSEQFKDHASLMASNKVTCNRKDKPQSSKVAPIAKQPVGVSGNLGFSLASI